MEIRAQNVNHGWKTLMRNILYYGNDQTIINKNGLPMRCIQLAEPVIVKITNFESIIPQDTMWKVPALNQYVANNMSAELMGFDYTYGQRILKYNSSYECFDQLKMTIDKLFENPTTRQAYIDIWNVNKDINAEHPPCLTLLDFAICENKLNLTAYIRSNDIFGAWPANIYLIIQILKLVKNVLNYRYTNEKIKLGELNVISNKAHIYMDDIIQAGMKTNNEEIANERFNKLKELSNDHTVSKVRSC